MEAPPSADADADAEGCRETAACPLIEEPLSAAPLPADPCAAVPPPNAASIPLLGPLPEPLSPPPWLGPPERPLSRTRPERDFSVLELDGVDVEACPMPASAPPIPPAVLRAPIAGTPGWAALGCELTAP